MERDRFTYRDLSQTLRAFKAAGVPIARVEVHRDGVIVFPGEPTEGGNLDAVAETNRLVEERLQNVSIRKTARHRDK
jgi:hypothetical protein